MKLLNAPYIDQTADWPTGCESVSAVMLLKYLGLDTDVADFVDGCLEKRPMIRHADGSLEGPDPRLYFAGDPRDPDSFGCYSGVIKSALERAFSARGLLDKPACAATDSDDPAQAVPEKYVVDDLTGVPIETILSDYIDRGMPVVFWTSIDLKETIPGPDWRITDSTDTFHWISNEHCVLLVGYDDDELIYNDPWTNNGVVRADRELVLKRHAEEHSMAVGVRRVEP